MTIPLKGMRTSAFIPLAWTIDMTTPEGTVEATLSIDDPATGAIAFPDRTMPLTKIDVDSAALAFSFNAGELGVATGRASRRGNRVEGTLELADGTLTFSGSMWPELPQQEGPTITKAQRAAITGCLRQGKGVAVTHAGLDALYDWDNYREMVGGGLFVSHPWTQSVRISVDEPENDAVRHFGDGFWIRDEIYVLDENPRWNARVLLSLDTESVFPVDDPAGKERNDCPISWIRNHGGGRVFGTKLGHFADVWRTPAILQHVLQGLRMAAGRLEADFSGQRIKEVFADNVLPDDIAVDERGNMWIAELRGKVHRYDGETAEVRQIAQLATTDPINIEHGLYGIKVDPNFYDGEPFVYLYYAEPATFINLLSRSKYRDGALTGEHVLLRVPAEPTCCHQGRDLEWGSKHTLLISTGDTGMSEVRPGRELTESRLDAFQKEHALSGYHWSRLVDSERSAQNLQDLRGKILRIHNDGSIPKDNPFFGEPGVRWEIYAYGLRNPYRFKLDSETGALYIGVVGPDAAFDYDEYNVSEEGGDNFGWPRTLGRLFYNEWMPDMIANYVPPVWEYTYESGGRSATVGPVYRHSGPGAFPELLQGKLFVFDWARRWVKVGDVVDGEFENDRERDMRKSPPSISLPAKRFVNIRTFDTLSRTAPISMELGPDGSLYVAEFERFSDAGPNARVTRYRWIEDNRAPAGEASARPDGANPLRFHFDGSQSTDPDADALQYQWDFGDGATGADPALSHTYRRAGQYTLRLVVTDPAGAVRRSDALRISAGKLP